MANLIHVVEHPEQVLQECHRILKKGGMMIIVTYTNVGMHLLDKIKMGLRFIKAWGKPPKHTHIFSLEKLAAMMVGAGFTIEEAKLIGNRSKAVFVIGKKG
jgi:ABC-2 type transport system ATP-binding protein